MLAGSIFAWNERHREMELNGSSLKVLKEFGFAMQNCRPWSITLRIAFDDPKRPNQVDPAKPYALVLLESLIVQFSLLVFE